LEIRIEPDFWLRRWFKVPFYFESTNPRFRLRVKRVAEPQATNAPLRLIANLPKRVQIQEGDERIVPLQIEFSDRTSSWEFLLVPNIAVGERVTLRTPEIMTASPGQTRLLLPFFTREGEQAPIWETAYAYHVRSEEQLWVWVVGLLIAGATILGQFR